MNKIYEKQTWHNDEAPALSEDNLNHIENGIDAIDTRLAGLTGTDIGVVDMTGATASAAGSHGLVPAPASGDEGKYLRGDGSWQNVAGGVTGVKGDAESSYRTGNVNITKANVGLGNVDNTSDLSKPVSTATQSALSNKQDKLTAGTGIAIDPLTNVISATGGSTPTVSGVKGNAESTYRTGNVNLTPANLGITSENTFTETVTGGIRLTGTESRNVGLVYYTGNIDLIMKVEMEDENGDNVVDGFLEVIHSGADNPLITFSGKHKFSSGSSNFSYKNISVLQKSNTEERCVAVSYQPSGNIVNRIIYRVMYVKGTSVSYGTTESCSTSGYTQVPGSVVIDDFYTEGVSLSGTVTADMLRANDNIVAYGARFNGGDFILKDGNTETICIESITGDLSGNAVDTAPTEDSNHIVTSGGVYEALTDGSVTKIGTGNVGSATQPVYIDGGVPTAMTGALAAVNGGTGDAYGKAPFVYTGVVTDANIEVQGSAEVNRRTIVSLINGNANNHAPTPNNWYILYTSSGSDTGADYGSQIAVGVNVETIWYRIKHDGTWREWNRIFGSGIKRIANDGDVNIDTYTATTKDIAQFHIAAGSATNSPDSAWYNYLTMSASGTGADYATQFAFGATWARLWFRNKNAGTWQPWHQIYGITTGTPTNPATGLSLQDSQFEKSGNVVVFRVAYKITSNVTLTGGFAVCTLPWTPAYITRVTRIVGDTNDSHTQNMSYGTLKTDKKLYGGPNDAKSTTGNYIEYYGTYMTND